MSGQEMSHHRGRRYRVGLIALVSVFFLAGVGASGTSKVLMVVREKSMDLPFFVKSEAAVMTNLLQTAGYSVDVATLSGQDIEADNVRLSCDVKLSDVKLDSYIAIVVPCMGAGDYSVQEELITLLKNADSKGMNIAAQHSLEVLWPGGLTKNRKVALAPGVVRDGNLITSYNCPYMALANKRAVDTEQLISTLVAAIQGK